MPFVPLSRNDNSEEARRIRKYKSNVENLELIDSVEGNKIDLSKLDLLTQQMYEELAKDNKSWRDTNVRYPETIMLQNQILLSNIEELKEKTNELKLKNEELLDMNHYLVEKAQEAEETQRLVIERKQKRQTAKKLQKRDYITPREFFDIVFHFVYKCEDSLYIISRNRFFLMYFACLRVSNLLLLTVRNIKDLMYNKVGTELRIIKGGRSNQLLSLGEDAQKLLKNDSFDDITVVRNDKDPQDPLFSSEKNKSVPLHGVTFIQDLNDTLKYAAEKFCKRMTCLF